MMTYKECCQHWSNLNDEERNQIRWRFFGETSRHYWETGPYETAMDAIPILDGGYVALLDHMGTDVDIVNAARISFQRESEGIDNNDRNLLKYLWTHRHTSPCEMVEFKFVVKCPIFVARQWHRHRTSSYNEVSRRYTDDELDFYNPNSHWIRTPAEHDRQASNECNEFGFMTHLEFIAARDVEFERYLRLLEDQGVCREQARMVLPQSMYTTFFAKVDLANLLHFIDIRMDPHAQWEIQQYSEAMAKMIGNIVPETMSIFMDGKYA